MAVVYSVWIINKAGGLIYHRFNESNCPHSNLSSNDCLMLASTFQSVHAISSKISPAGGEGVQTLSYDSSTDKHSFQLHCLHTLTGLKILLATSTTTTNTTNTSSTTSNIEALLRRIYEIYSDYALKNPFHTVEMPIRSELFDTQILKLVLTSK